MPKLCAVRRALAVYHRRSGRVTQYICRNIAGGDGYEGIKWPLMLWDSVCIVGIERGHRGYMVVHKRLG